MHGAVCPAGLQAFWGESTPPAFLYDLVSWSQWIPPSWVSGGVEFSPPGVELKTVFLCRTNGTFSAGVEIEECRWVGEFSADLVKHLVAEKLVGSSPDGGVENIEKTVKTKNWYFGFSSGPKKCWIWTNKWWNWTEKYWNWTKRYWNSNKKCWNWLQGGVEKTQNTNCWLFWFFSGPKVLKLKQNVLKLDQKVL